MAAASLDFTLDSTGKSESTLARFAMRRPLILFFLLAYAFAWIGWLPIILSHAGLGWIPGDLPASLIVIGLFGPTVSALTVQWVRERNLRICHFRTSWRDLVLGLVVGVGLVLLVCVIGPAVATSRTPVRMLNWRIFLAWSPWHLLILIGGPINEEPGWRGFALPRLQRRFGAVGASVVLGLLWGAWHLPLFLLHGWARMPIGNFILLAISLAVLFTLATNWSGFSIVVPVCMHFTVNASGFLLDGLLESAQMRPRIDLVTAAIEITVATLTVVLTRGRLGAEVATDPGMMPTRPRTNQPGKVGLLTSWAAVTKEADRKS
jgi:membrane protease YdiL (CAAX protease family)